MKEGGKEVGGVMDNWAGLEEVTAQGQLPPRGATVLNMTSCDQPVLTVTLLSEDGSSFHTGGCWGSGEGTIRKS